MAHTDYPKLWDNETRSKWIIENQRLIHRAIEPYKNTTAFDSYDDLYQSANLSVIKAMNSYTPGGSKFSTYVVTVIRNDLMNDLRASHAKKRQAIVTSLDESPYTDSPEKDAYEITDLSMYNKPGNYENSPSDILAQKELIEIVKNACLILTPEEKFVIDRILAGWTQYDIADIFDCSQSKISTIRGNIKIKVSRELQKAGFRY